MKFLLLFWTAVFGLQASAETREVRAFENPAEVSDDYINTPYDMDIAADGRIVLGDHRNNRILVWKADGSFSHAFGQQGQGPGEFNGVQRLRVHDDLVYLCDAERKISVFQLDGTFVRAFKYPKQLRTFAPLNPDLLLVMYRTADNPDDIQVAWELIDGKGSTVRELGSEHESLFVGKVGEGDNEAHIRTFAGEGEIQDAGDGTFYYGYGHHSMLHHIDRQGKDLGSVTFDLKTTKPDDRDQDLINTLSFPGPGGKRIGLKDLPGIKVHWDYDKDYFTQFTIQGDTVLLALTPLGGTGGIGIGFHDVTYVVCDLKTGKPLKRGRYQYPEDSKVLFNKGRCIAYLIDAETDEYKMVELQLDGMAAPTVATGG